MTEPQPPVRAVVRGRTLHAIPGCARCADLIAAGLLGADVYDRLAQHQENHVPGPSIWREVNEIAEEMTRTKFEIEAVGKGWVIDLYGSRWPREYVACPECGQPDNCGDCNHTPLHDSDVLYLGGLPACTDDECWCMNSDGPDTCVQEAVAS